MEAMYKMFKKVNGEPSHVWFNSTTSIDLCSPCVAREKIVGWYSTGPKLKEADLDINSLMSKYTDGSAEPVLVICEVEVSILGHITLLLLRGGSLPALRLSHVICDN